MQQLLDYISSLHPLTNEIRDVLTASFTQVPLEKNGFLIREGQVSRHLYFLEKGCVRGFYNLEGKEVTYWFGFENDFVTSFHSFTTGQPSVEYIQMMEDGILLAVSRERLDQLLKQFHEVESILRKAYEKYYVRLEERFVNDQFRTARERYERLLQESPHILERAPLGYIASFLGISQETLSRVRGRL